MAKKATANPVVETIAPVAPVEHVEPSAEIGVAQAKVALYLTTEVVALIDESAKDIEDELKHKAKGTFSIKKLADLLYANGAKWYMVGTKAPKDITETAEDSVLRDELTRQVRDRIEHGFSPMLRFAVDYDVAGSVRDWNKQQKAKGLASSTAVELDSLGIIPPGTMERRKIAQDIVSQYLRRLSKALKGLEPKSEVEESTGESEAESEANVPERTPEQKALIELAKAYAHFIKAAPSSKVDATVHVIGELLKEWGESLPTDSAE